MHFRHLVISALTVALVMTMAPRVSAQGRLATAKALSCSFQRSATASWSKAGAATAVVKPSTLVLRFEAIDFDDGTAQLRTGKVASEVVAKTAENYRTVAELLR